MNIASVSPVGEEINQRGKTAEDEGGPESGIVNSGNGAPNPGGRSMTTLTINDASSQGTLGGNSSSAIVAGADGGVLFTSNDTVVSAANSVLLGNAGGLQFNISYDNSVNSAPAGFTAAMAYVASYYSTLFTDPITVTLDIGWGEIAGQSLGAGALGESETSLEGIGYSQLRSALQSDAKTAGDATAVASLPSNNPTGGNIFVATAEARALGLTGNVSVDGYAGFSSSVTYTFDPSNRAVPGAYDFIGVAEHEISEVMGRIALLGTSLGNTPNTYSALDLFRYSAPGARQLLGGRSAYFSIDGGQTNLDNFNTTAGGDWGDWAASAGNDAYAAFTSSGVANAVTNSDLSAMDAIGWDRAPLQSISPDGSILMAGSGGNLVTSAGAWTFDTTQTPYGNLILLNGQSAAGGSALELEVANHGNLYADNDLAQWYEWNGSGWTGTANPNSGPISLDGSILMAGSGGNLVTDAGTWTFDTRQTPYGNLILLNGQSAAGGSAIELEVANQGNLYADNNLRQWYQWNSTGWIGSNNPNPQSVSPDGSLLMAGSGGNLVTGAGTWTFDATQTPYGNLILLNGQSAAGGSAIELEVANRGNLYADNNLGQWYQWNGSGWTGTGDPMQQSLSSGGSPRLESNGGGSPEIGADGWRFTRIGNSMILLPGKSAATSTADLNFAQQGQEANPVWPEWSNRDVQTSAGPDAAFVQCTAAAQTHISNDFFGGEKVHLQSLIDTNWPGSSHSTS